MKSSCSTSEFSRFVLLPSSLIGLLISGCSSPAHNRVEAIDITEYGVLTYSGGITKKDPTSSMGADLTKAPVINLATTTNRIPLREGLTFGVGFVVKGPTEPESIPITVIVKSSTPCTLRTTGVVVYQNDIVLNVRVGLRRYVGARIARENDNPCVEPPGPGIETFELYYQGKKYAEKQFLVVPDDSAQ